MAKNFTDNGSRNGSAAKNPRFSVSYKLNGKPVKTVGLTAKDENAAFAYVRRSLNNLGIETKGIEFAVAPATAR